MIPPMPNPCPRSTFQMQIMIIQTRVGIELSYMTLNCAVLVNVYALKCVPHIRTLLCLEVLAHSSRFLHYASFLRTIIENILLFIKEKLHSTLKEGGGMSSKRFIYTKKTIKSLTLDCIS